MDAGAGADEERIFVWHPASTPCLWEAHRLLCSSMHREHKSTTSVLDYIPTYTQFSRCRTPLSVRLQAGALFSILDHYLRRKDSQKRVIGTLTGIRTDNEVEVRTAFAVLHSETADQVAIDEEYFRNMLEISQRVNPKEQVVGWCVVRLSIRRLNILSLGQQAHFRLMRLGTRLGES